MAANQVDLCVLAPRSFYRSSYLAALEEALDASLERIGEAEGVQLSFRFDVLEDDLLTDDLNDVGLLERLEARPWLFE